MRKYLLLPLLLFACQRYEPITVMHTEPAATERRVIEEPYPSDISPPPGLHYPCALTPLPKSMVGVPEADRAYINRTYARVLRATQAKLVVLAALYGNSDFANADAVYEKKVAGIVDNLHMDAVPEGLEPFRDDVVTAIELQRTFFRKGAEMRARGASMDQVYALNEGHAASSKLMSAWGKMQSRYPSWDDATKESIYHHLCALDLF